MADSQRFTILNKRLWRHRKTAEYEAFVIISREVSDKTENFSESAVVNSLAIRPYVPVMRSFTDLDIAFPTHVPFEKILQIANNFTDHKGILPMPKPNRSLHIKYHIPRMRELDLTTEFSIHLHSGGVWYKEELFGLDNVFFESTDWIDVPSAAQMAPSLPIPKFEELFLLKIIKFLGLDKIDILSMLSFPSINIPYVIDRVKETGKADRIVANLEEVKSKFGHIKDEWSYEHLLSMSDEVEDEIKFNLNSLLESLTCQQ